jgi:hypothetical protein
LLKILNQKQKGMHIEPEGESQKRDLLKIPKS